MIKQDKMALRKNNQADYNNFADTTKDVLGKEKDPPKRIMGENTGLTSLDKKGNRFALVLDDVDNGIMAGDTIRPVAGVPMVDGNGPGSGTGGKYIHGGDYDIEETKNSEKRPNGPKTYNIK
jgi:hypothetical protein